MRRLILCACAVLSGFAVQSQAQAGALDLLDFDGQFDRLQDNDFETFIDVDNDGTIEIGDFVVGMFEMENIDGTVAAVAGSTFEGILVARIADITGLRLTFGAVSAADYEDLQDGTIASLTSLPTRLSDSSAVILYDDSTMNESQADGTVFIDQGAGAGINDALATATDGTLLFEFGFTGNAFAFSTVNSLTFAAINDIDFAVGLNRTASGSPALAGLSFIPVNPLGIAPTDIQGAGNDDFIGLSQGHFQLPTDVDFQVNIVPEPGSLTLLGLGMIGLLGGSRLRRKQAA